MKIWSPVLLLTIPAVAGAQTLPGSAELDDSRLRPGSWEVTVTIHRGEQVMPGGTVRYDLAALPDGRWAYIATVTSERGTATDTSIAHRATLVPITHRGHSAARVLSLDYDGRRVTGTLAPRDSAPHPIERTTDAPTFDAAMLDLVLGSLPLAPGYETRLPLYVEEQGGLTWVGVTVEGETSADGVAAWSVLVSMPPRTVRYLLARDDHRFLSARMEHPNGTAVEVARR